LLLAAVRAVLGDDLALVDAKDAVREGEDLVEFEGDEQHRLAVVSSLDQPAMNEFARADVEATGRLGSDQDAGFASDLTREHDLLLIAAGARRCPSLRATAPDVLLLQHVARSAN